MPDDRDTLRRQLADDVEFWNLPQKTLPLFMRPKSGKLQALPEFVKWVGEHRKQLDELILREGGIVLRGFPMKTAQDFNQIAQLFPAYGGGYVGGNTPRKTVEGRVMEATQLGPEVRINLHQEMAYLKTYPPRIAFFCRLKAASGGETTIASMRQITEWLPAWLRPLLEQHGVRGVSNFAAPGSDGGKRITDNYDDKTWESSYGSNSKAEVDEICKGMGQQPIWNKDGSLTVMTDMPAFATHPVTGERFYRSILHVNYLTYEYNPLGMRRREAMIAAGKLPTGFRLGNGHELTREESRELEQVVEEARVVWDWEEGDLMILDNLQVAHGRERFTGERETLVSLFD